MIHGSSIFFFIQKDLSGSIQMQALILEECRFIKGQMMKIQKLFILLLKRFLPMVLFLILNV